MFDRINKSLSSGYSFLDSSLSAGYGFLEECTSSAMIYAGLKKPARRETLEVEVNPVGTTEFNIKNIEHLRFIKKALKKFSENYNHLSYIDTLSAAVPSAGLLFWCLNALSAWYAVPVGAACMLGLNAYYDRTSAFKEHQKLLSQLLEIFKWCKLDETSVVDNEILNNLKTTLISFLYNTHPELFLSNKALPRRNDLRQVSHVMFYTLKGYRYGLPSTEVIPEEAEGALNKESNADESVGSFINTFWNSTKEAALQGVEIVSQKMLRPN